MALRQQLKGLLWLLAAAAAAFLLAAGLPFLAARVPWSVERRLGRWLDARPAASCGAGAPQAQALLARLTARLYPILPGDEDFPLSVRVIPGSEVNAFASLGGRVYVYDGLLEQTRSPEELAGVLAHEIEHVKRRHIIEGAAARFVTSGALRLVFPNKAGAAGLLANLTFSREQEREADAGGLARLRAARVSTAGFAEFFERLGRKGALPAFLSDHPASADRAALAQRYAGGPSRPILDARDWKTLQSICDGR